MSDAPPAAGPLAAPPPATTAEPARTDRPAVRPRTESHEDADAPESAVVASYLAVHVPEGSEYTGPPRPLSPPGERAGRGGVLPLYPTPPPMSETPHDRPAPDGQPPRSGDDRDVSEREDPQAMGLFTEPAESDVRLDPDHPAFDRVQDGKDVDGEYEREYNRRYVKEHGDHRGRKGEAEREADRDAARGD